MSARGGGSGLLGDFVCLDGFLGGVENDSKAESSKDGSAQEARAKQEKKFLEVMPIQHEAGVDRSSSESDSDRAAPLPGLLDFDALLFAKDQIDDDEPSGATTPASKPSRGIAAEARVSINLLPHNSAGNLMSFVVTNFENTGGEGEEQQKRTKGLNVPRELRKNGKTQTAAADKKGSASASSSAVNLDAVKIVKLYRVLDEIKNIFGSVIVEATAGQVGLGHIFRQVTQQREVNNLNRNCWREAR